MICSLSCTSSSLKALAEHPIRSSRCNSRKMLIDFLSLCPFDAKAIDHCKYQQSQPISTLLSSQVRLCITLSLLYVSHADGRCFRYPCSGMVRKLCWLFWQTLQDFWLRSCILSGIVPDLIHLGTITLCCRAGFSVDWPYTTSLTFISSVLRCSNGCCVLPIVVATFSFQIAVEVDRQLMGINHGLLYIFFFIFLLVFYLG